MLTKLTSILPDYHLPISQPESDMFMISLFASISIYFMYMNNLLININDTRYNVMLLKYFNFL